MFDPDIDALYDAFCLGLSATERSVARALAFRLNLVPDPGIPWSQVFKHRVTLAAPALFVEAMPPVHPGVVERAVLAHMLAVIEAFGTDRIADGQTIDEPELRAVLGCLQSARDRAIAEVGGHDAVAMMRAADDETAAAITTERGLLSMGKPVSPVAYHGVSAAKQAVGLPASLALGRRAGWSDSALQTARTALTGIWLGLQFFDDVADWDEDAEKGGAWAVALALHQRAARDGLHTSACSNASEVRTLVLSSAALAHMLELSIEQFRAALSAAAVLGAQTLCEWIQARQEEVLASFDREKSSPGYLARLKRLRPWALELLD